MRRLGQRDRGELHPVDHVAEGEDARHAGLESIVDDDRAARVHFDTQRLQAQPGAVRAPAGGHQHGIGRHGAAVVEHDAQRPVGAFDRGRPDGGAQHDPMLCHLPR